MRLDVDEHFESLLNKTQLYENSLKKHNKSVTEKIMNETIGIKDERGLRNAEKKIKIIKNLEKSLFRNSAFKFHAGKTVAGKRKIGNLPKFSVKSKQKHRLKRNVQPPRHVATYSGLDDPKNKFFMYLGMTALIILFTFGILCRILKKKTVIIILVLGIASFLAFKR